MIKKAIAIWMIVFLITGVLIYSAREAQATLYFVKEFIIKPLVREIANSLENKLVNSVNKTISGITKNQPSFVTNWRNHILDSQARGNNVFLSVLADTELCDYFGSNLKTLFGADKFVGAIAGATTTNFLGKVVYENKTYIPGLPSFQTAANCTLPDNFDVDLYREDFEQGGGWDAWDKLIEPQNNFLGALDLAFSEQEQQISIDQKSSQNEAISGGGFLSQKLDLDDATSATGCVDQNEFGSLSVPRCTFLGKIVTPAQILGQSATNEINTKLGRVGGGTELSDILLKLAGAVVKGITSRLKNYIGQSSYEQPAQGGESFDESSVPTQDPTVDPVQLCMDDCLRQAREKCTIEAKTSECTITGGSGSTGASTGGTGGSATCTDEIDQAKYNACFAEEESICRGGCSTPRGLRNP